MAKTREMLKGDHKNNRSIWSIKGNGPDEKKRGGKEKRLHTRG